MTSDRVLARMRAGPGLAALQIAPKADGLLAWGGGAASLWSYRMAHPEVTPGSVFGATWYEGYSEPQFTWQSSSGTDDFEPKLSLVPLIFGTLKATFYALLFSVPIALLAAIYTSEFLSRRARSVVKPAIEMMASLPSVVLGFLAALVLAPWVEQSVLGVLFAFFLVPLAVVLGAYLWLFVPQRLAVRLDGTPKLALTAAVIVLALAAAFPAGRVLERACFAGDLRAWLAPPHPGNATGFWAALLFVPGVVCAAALRRRVVDPLLARGPARTRGQEAFVELLKGGSVVLGALALCWLGGAAMNALGLDPRGSLVGTYVQRNTLVVGFVMGFAVIPIIYTIAEDALSAVPDHLRGAALGCGATRWQTAIRVVVPTAMSGIFSACMIGLGRAVGETMIVVMAAGNTPILDVNVFNGLRALSATIAVELPEAVKGGTLYRMLFLAALTLFGMTFVVNTAAEVVRQRFRKRAFEL
ncbi:MAG: ABC transporter permease subunit [Planctomycetota bacterium]|nr:MAG: ABC transporter permease subunit [Planctomycetota bacterium]